MTITFMTTSYPPVKVVFTLKVPLLYAHGTGNNTFSTTIRSELGNEENSSEIWVLCGVTRWRVCCCINCYCGKLVVIYPQNINLDNST
jgi:hypothetical protein